MPSERPSILRRLLAGSLLLLALDAALPARAWASDRDPQAPSEYDLKVAFIYNFIKFVEWPPEGSGERKDLQLCVLGDAPVKAPFADLQGQELIGRRLVLAMLKEPQDVRSCQVLFVAQAMSRRMKEVLAAVKGRPVLTIGDTDGYARQGIMINMYIEKKRIRFEINTEAARAAGLRISARLLNLAGSIYGGVEDE